MVYQRWKRSNKSVYNVGYHLIWCPKYRRQVLVGEIEMRLKEYIDEGIEARKAIVLTDIIEFAKLPLWDNIASGTLLASLHHLV